MYMLKKYSPISDIFLDLQVTMETVAIKLYINTVYYSYSVKILTSKMSGIMRNKAVPVLITYKLKKPRQCIFAPPRYE